MLTLAQISGQSLIRDLLVLLIIGIVLGIFAYIVNVAPFVNAMWKTVLQWIILIVGALILINFLLGLIGKPIVTW